MKKEESDFQWTNNRMVMKLSWKKIVAYTIILLVIITIVVLLKEEELIYSCKNKMNGESCTWPDPRSDDYNGPVSYGKCYNNECNVLEDYKRLSEQ